MEQNNRPPRQYSGTKGLSFAIVVGVALGTVIGKLTGNMQTGLMIGLVLAVCGWTLLINRRAKSADREAEDEQSGDKIETEDKKETE